MGIVVLVIYAICQCVVANGSNKVRCWRALSTDARMRSPFAGVLLAPQHARGPSQRPVPLLQSLGFVTAACVYVLDILSWYYRRIGVITSTETLVALIASSRLIIVLFGEEYW